MDYLQLNMCICFIEQKLMLSSRFRCGQSHDGHKYDFGHTLWCYLSQTYMFIKPNPGLLNKNSCLATALGVTKITIVTDMKNNISQSYMFNKPTSCSTVVEQR